MLTRETFLVKDFTTGRIYIRSTRRKITGKIIKGVLFGFYSLMPKFRAVLRFRNKVNLNLIPDLNEIGGINWTIRWQIFEAVILCNQRTEGMFEQV